KQILFCEAILRGFQSGRLRIDGNTLGQKISSFDGDVFEFVGDQFKTAGKFFERGLIGVIGGDALGDAAYGRFRRRIKETEVQTKRVARQREHVAELSAAEDTDSHARFPFFFDADAPAAGSGLARTRTVCSARNFRTASRKGRCLVPRMEAARRAALTAPDLPMASVPTGTPPGICEIGRASCRERVLMVACGGRV